MASGYHYQELAPGGCSLAVFLKLHYHSPIPSESQQLYLHRGQLQTQLVTARDDLLTIYDVYERPTSSLSAHTSTSSITNSSTSHKLVISRKHNLFGIVTGLQRIQTLSSDTDHRDRLLVSFADAKIALLEWNDATDDLETVSIHTYERAPQLLNGTPHLFQPNLSVDPLSRCAALLLPHDALAILPFYRDAAEFDLDKDFHLDNLAQDDAAAVAAAKDMESLPYSPSFVLTMPEVDAKIRNLKDFCFLPGFQKPTVAVLFQYSPTWTGLLAERKDTYSVFLFTLDLSASLDGMTLDNNNGTTRSLHPVVTTSSPLPLDCLYMIPCPQTLGGVLVVCMSSILHVDQSGRVVVTALNSWFKSVSSIEPESVLELQGLDDLQGSQIVFTSETEGLLTLVSGDLYRVVCQMDGRSVEGMRLERMNESFSASEELKAATGSPSSCLAIAPQNNHSSANGGSLAYLFNASTAGDSTLYNLVPVRKPLTSSQEEDASAKPEPTSTAHDMDLDLDDDLYGTSDALTTNNAKTNGSSKHETILTVRKVDTVRSHGGLHSVARRKLTEEESGSFKRHELVAACGSGNQAGIVYLDPRFVPQHRTVLVSEAGTETPSFSKVFTLNKESNGRIRMIGSRSNEDLSMAFTAPGEVSTVPSQKQGTWTDSVELSGATLCAGLLLGGDCVARITSNSVQVLSLDTTEVVHETKLESRIQHASLDASQYAVIHTWDSETLIFNFDASKREFETVDTSAILTGPIISANIFRDTFHNLSPALGSKFKEAVVESGADAAAAQSRAIFGSYSNDDEEQIDYGEDDDDQSMVAPTNGNHINGSNTTTAAVEAAPAYVFTLDLDSTARIFSLPNLELVWQNFSVAAQPQRLRYESQGHTELAPEQVATISTAVACHLGDMICLVSVTSDNFLTVYKANAFGHADEKLKTAGEGMQALTFNKLFVQLLAVPAARAFDSSANGFKTGAVQLEPFSVGSAEGMVASSNALTVLGGGKESSASVLCWTAEGGHKVLDWPQGDLVCLGAIPTGSMQSECCSWTGAADYAYVDRSGTLFMGQLPPGLDSTSSWSSRIVRTGRSYTRITTHNPTHCVVAASILPHQFVLFDEDGEAIASHGSEDATTVSYRGALELFIGQDRSTPVDGYEFEQNETVTSLEVVTLDAPSTTSGCKQFIAAGTTTYHGEDRTCKGSVYLFEIISVVSSAKDEIGNDFRLKLITRDDSRAPVTAICELNGFLVHTSGQKLYVRALEKEEWLISVAFLDCPFLITSIRVVKNFLVLSDVEKSIWFLAFQEEPYRFVDLGKDLMDCHVSLGDFLAYNDRVSIVSTSGISFSRMSAFGTTEGVIRLYEYSPNNPSCLGGHRLMLKTEYQTCSVAVSCVRSHGKWLSDFEIRGKEEMRNKLIFAKANGGLESLAALDENVLKRLHVLQGQLVRSVEHFGALNPRGFRNVRNEFVARSLNKGILDGRLLDTFFHLSRPKMLEAVRSLAGMFDGMDQIKNQHDQKRKRNKSIPSQIQLKVAKMKTDKDDQDESDNHAATQAKQTELQDRNNDDNNNDDDDDDDDDVDDDVDFTKQEQLRLQSEAKRVQLVLKDLLRLRLGFEQV